MAKKRKMKLIMSSARRPNVKLKKGAKLKAVAVTLLNPQLKKPKARAARLCGGTDTCMALVEI
jgi:hypothetical protein